jgi:hypothetical protein
MKIKKPVTFSFSLTESSKPTRPTTSNFEHNNFVTVTMKLVIAGGT